MRFCYINIASIYPHDIHLLDGLRALGHEVLEINEPGHGLQKYASIYKKYRTTDRAFDAVIIGYTCPHFVPLARVMTTHPVIFNAGASQYEANVISRGAGNMHFLRAFKWWLVDFISFHFASQVLLESNSQIEFIRKSFLVSKNKLKLSWTGVDEKQFFKDSSIQKRKTFTVLFRGRFLAESGIDTIIKAAKILETTGIQFLIIGHGFLHKTVDGLLNELKPKNIEMAKENLPAPELRRKMLECHISLGQLADHPRLDRTLPCKLFESLALGLPYLSGRNKAALELLTENETCACANPGDEQDLANKILELSRNWDLLEKIGRQGYELHQSKLTSKILAQQFLEQSFPTSK